MGYGAAGNYTERDKPATYRPGDGRVELMEVIYDGYLLQYKLGRNRHAVPSKRLPAWAAAVLTAAREGEEALLFAHAGSAGKFGFWGLPQGIACAAEWMRASAEAVAARREESAARAADAAARQQAATAAACNAALAEWASANGGIIVDAVIADQIIIEYGCVREHQPLLGSALAECGTIARVSPYWCGRGLDNGLRY